jgi:lipopolysaccharide heptosyltransferase II
MNRLVILAPNWLGDAVMALPAIADVRRALPRVDITVAARPSIAPLFNLVAEIDRTVVIDARTRGGRPGVELGRHEFDAALLLPNSIRTAVAAVLAKIPERWGYRGNGRRFLLTRAVHRPSGLHQVEYYQQLVHALGFPNGPIEPRITVPVHVRGEAVGLLREVGWDGTTPIVALSPGAAYGGAKRWPPDRFGQLAESLAHDGVQSVVIGTAADASGGNEVARACGAALPLLTLVGRTDLPMLAGVLATCRALVTNDSGAMHLAAAAGIPVTAVFGPTDERATRPLGDAEVLTFPVWCRPCMLRECPLDHRCMRGIDVDSVAAAARRRL